MRPSRFQNQEEEEEEEEVTHSWREKQKGNIILIITCMQIILGITSDGMKQRYVLSEKER